MTSDGHGAYGERRYITLDARTRAEAEAELSYILEQVRRGDWKPTAVPADVAPAEEPTLRGYASEWLAGKRQEGLSPRTVEDYEWCLTHHLLPALGRYRLSELTPTILKRYVRYKADEGTLSANSINKTLSRLSTVLADAMDEGLVGTNVAAGKWRRLKGTKPTRQHLDRADQIASLSQPRVTSTARLGRTVGESAGARSCQCSCSRAFASARRPR